MNILILMIRLIIIMMIIIIILIYISAFSCIQHAAYINLHCLYYVTELPVSTLYTSRQPSSPDMADSLMQLQNLNLSQEYVAALKYVTISLLLTAINACRGRKKLGITTVCYSRILTYNICEGARNHVRKCLGENCHIITLAFIVNTEH